MHSTLYDINLTHFHGIQCVVVALWGNACAGGCDDVQRNFRIVRLDEQCVGDNTDVGAKTAERNALKILLFC